MCLVSILRRAAATLFFLATIIFSLQSASAQAIDGVYIGVHGGWINVLADADLETFEAGAAGNVLLGNNIPWQIENDTDGFMGGIQAGVSKQNNGFMLGLEGDFSWTGIDERTIVNLPGGGALPGQPSTTTLSMEMEWFATLRLWAGTRVTPELFLYATGGAAFADIDESISLVLNPATAGSFRGADNDVEVGWTVGAGAEWSLGGGWSMKTEYLYYDIQDTSLTISDPNFPNSDMTYEFDNTGHIVRVGLNYSFAPFLFGQP